MRDSNESLQEAARSVGRNASCEENDPLETTP